MMNLTTPDQSGPELNLISLAHRFEGLARIGKDEGIEIRPYTDVRLPHFHNLDLNQRIELIGLFDNYYNVIAEVKEEERRVLRNLTTVWRMLGKSRLIPSPDLFNFVEEEDVIEIYDLSSHQLFRSFNFFPLCSYSLEELYAIPWFDLYERPLDHTHAKHVALLGNILSGKYQKTESIPIERHIVRENRSPGRPVRCNLVEPRFISPLYDRGGKLGGFVHAFRPVETWDEA